MSQIAFRLRQLLQGMWFLPAAFSLMAVLTILIAYGLARLAPEQLPFTMPSNGVETILSILASSLLTVAVFALSTITSALSSASSLTSPRAVPLIVGDRGAQTSISVFIGAFLFSVVGIIGLNSGVYSEAGRLFLFLVTLGVLALVVTALIRWIGQISAIGRVEQTIDKVEAATREAFHTLAEHPQFGCQLHTGMPQGEAVSAGRLGYVQHMDAARLQDLAEQHDLTIAVTARPGAYVGPGRPLMLVTGAFNEDIGHELRDAFTIDKDRTFDSDPRFGLIVLSEIASKALSPAVNDPGTAIDIIGTLVRVLCESGAEEDRAPSTEVRFDRVAVPPLEPADLIQDAFRPVSRDGAGNIEVMQRLLAGLRMLAACNPELREPAIAMAQDAIERAKLALSAPSDLIALQEAGAFAENLSNLSPRHGGRL